MFQAVLVGCILINFFIYDPLLYFLKKLAGAKNLLDLHALGRGSDVRYMQECIKMKQSQSLQNGQAAPGVVPRLPAGSLGCLGVCPTPGLRSLLSLLAAATSPQLLRGACGDPGGRWWPWGLQWPRQERGSAYRTGLAPHRGLKGPSRVPWPPPMASQANITLPFLPFSWQHIWGCALFYVCWFHRREACLANKTN